MSEDKNLEDILKSKFSESDFLFDEENWAKAEVMIDAMRKKEKRRRFGIIFFFATIIGLLVWMPFVWMDFKSEKANVQKNQNSTNSLAEVNNSNGKNVIVLQPLSTKQSNEIIDSASDQKSKLQEENSSNRNEIKKGFNAKSNLNSAETIPNSKSILVTDKTNSEKNTNKSKNKTDLNSIVSPSKSNPKIKKENKKVDEPQDIDVSEIETPSSEQMNKENKSLEFVKQMDANQELPPTLTNSSEATSGIAVSIASNITPDTSLQQVPMSNKDSANLVKTVPEKDTAKSLLNSQMEVKDTIPKSINSWILSLDAGINAFLSGGNGISPIGGINILKPINEKWEIGSGLNYTYIPTYTGVSTFTTDTKYDFGSSFTLTEIVTTKLHYVTIPLFIKHNFNQKNSILFGADFYYLFNSTNMVTTYESTYAGIQNKTTKKSSGYFNGFTPYDVGVIAGYRRRLFENFGVTIKVNYGILNLQKQGSISGSNLHNNISGQLMVTYSLSK